MTLPETPPPTAPHEPLLTVGSVTAFVAAVAALGAAFGLPLSDAQTNAVLGVVAILAPLVVALVGRAKVFSPATVREMVQAAEIK